MDGKVDLHIHSHKSSDGDFSIFHILHLAHKNGFRAISITDHDTVAAYPRALQVGEELGVEVIPGIELTTMLDSREFHLLLPFVNWKAKATSRIVQEISKRRVQEARKRVAKLQQLGFSISWDEVQEKSKPHPPLGVTIAQILLQKAEKHKEHPLQKYLQGKDKIFAPYRFYQDYFMEGKPAYVPKNNVKLLDLLEKVSQTGGVPVLAHPGSYFQKTTREDLLLLKEKGLEGLEVYTSYHNQEQTGFYKELARELGLVSTAGSDFHGKIKPHIPFGCLNNGNYEMVQELKERRP